MIRATPTQRGFFEQTGEWVRVLVVDAEQLAYFFGTRPPINSKVFEPYTRDLRAVRRERHLATASRNR